MVGCNVCDLSLLIISELTDKLATTETTGDDLTNQLQNAKSANSGTVHVMLYFVIFKSIILVSSNNETFFFIAQ